MKKRRAFVLIFIFGLFFDLGIHGQSLISGEDNFIYRVKQLDQFVGRFNGTETIAGRKLAERPGFQRDMKSWRTLVRQDGDSEYRKKLTKFLRYVIDSNVFLSMDEEGLYASLKCDVVYKGKSHKLNLTLSNEGSPIEGYEWAIAGASASFLAIEPDTDNVDKFIHPADHNTDFISAKRVFNDDQRNIAAYASKEHKVDQLSILFFLIKTGQVEMKAIKEISFAFLNVPNWVLLIEKFDRLEGNSGYLLSEIQYAPEKKDKESFRKQQLFVNEKAVF